MIKTIQRLRLFSLFCLFTFSSFSFAAVSLPKPPDFLHLDGTLGLAFSTANASKAIGASYASDPILLNVDLGITGAYRYSMFLAGLTTDFRINNQVSAIKKLTGNYSGYRWNIVSPTIGVRTDMFVAKLDVQFLGAYNVNALTKNKESIRYTGPLGFRGTYLHNLEKYIGLPIHAGGQLEWVRFSTVTTSKDGKDRLKDMTLKTPVEFWQIGLAAAYVL